MKVYCLLIGFAYEGETLVSVYSSLEEAKKEAHKSAEEFFEFRRDESTDITEDDEMYEIKNYDWVVVRKMELK